MRTTIIVSRDILAVGWVVYAEVGNKRRKVRIMLEVPASVHGTQSPHGYLVEVLKQTKV